MANTGKESKYLLSLFDQSNSKTKDYLLNTSEELIKKKILEDDKFKVSFKDLEAVIDQKKDLILFILEQKAKKHQEDTLYLSFILMQKLKIYKYFGEFTESQEVLNKINEIIKNDDTKIKTKIIVCSLLKLNYVKEAEIALKEVEKDDFLEDVNILINFINDNYKYQETIDSLIKNKQFLSKKNELINNTNIALGINFNTVKTLVDSLCLLRTNDQRLTNIYKQNVFTNLGFEEGQYIYYFLLLYLYQNKKENTSLYLLKHMKEIKYSKYKQMKGDQNVLALYYCIKSILYYQSKNNEKSFKALSKFKKIEINNNNLEYKTDFSIDSFSYIETKIKAEVNSLDEKLVKILSENKKREIINNIINPKKKDNKTLIDDLEFLNVGYPYFLSRNNRKEIINLTEDELITKCKNDHSFLLSISAEEIINISKDYNRIKTSIKILNLKLENSISDFEYGYILLYLIQETAKISKNKADIYELYNLFFKIPKKDENCTIFNCIFINLLKEQEYDFLLKIVNERFTEMNINKNINFFLIYAKKNDIENVSKYYALMNIFQQDALKIIYFTFQKKYEQIIEMCEQKLLAKKDYAYAIMSAIRINNYNKAHELASKLFDNVDQKECPPFRYGMSLLLDVYSYYKQNQYKEAEDLLEKFKEQSQLKFIYEECQTNYGLSPFFYILLSELKKKANEIDLSLKYLNMAYCSFYKVNITLTFYYFDLVDEIVFEKIHIENKLLIEKVDMVNNSLNEIKRNKEINKQEIQTIQKNLEQLNEKVINNNDKMEKDQNQLLLQEVMKMQQMMEKFHGEINSIKYDNKELKEGYKNLVKENKEIKKKAEKIDNQINNLEEIAENSGTAKMSELKKRLKELEKTNPNKAYYSQVFQENLYTIILKYRMNREGFIENKSIEVGQKIVGVLADITGNIPIIGKIISISEVILDKIREMRGKAAYENQRESILNTFYATKSMQNEYDFQMLCFEISLIIAEDSHAFDEENKYKKITAQGASILNFIKEKKEELENWVSGRQDCPYQQEAFIAMEDATLLIAYIAENSKSIIDKWKDGVPIADILAKSVLLKDIHKILQEDESKKEADDKVTTNCCMVL